VTEAEQVKLWEVSVSTAVVITYPRKYDKCSYKLP